MLILGLCLLNLTGIAQARTRSTKTVKSKSAKSDKSKTGKKKKIAKVQYGTASFYSNKFNGRRTASGEIFSQKKLTAAHNSLPLGTWVKVTNLRNKKTVVVKITDRLHYSNKRVIDLSKAAATALSFGRAGLVQVKLQILGKTNPVTTK